jgi:hypothetical protein
MRDLRASGGRARLKGGIFRRGMVDSAFVNDVRLRVLEVAADTGQVPGANEVAHGLGRDPADVVEAFRQLGESHVYVVEPGDPSRLRMANPYSAVPTPFRVEVAGRSYFGNCVWDSLGIISLLGGDGRVLTPCPDCQVPQELRVVQRRLVAAEGLVHFSVPARHWWDDIIHT